MTILKIIGFAFGGFFLVSVFKGMVDGATHTISGTITDYLNNKHNELNFLQGSLMDGNELIDQYLNMDKAQVEQHMNETNLNLHEISNAVYFYAMRHIQANKVQEGFDMLHIAADDYLNPIAITKLARIYYHGPAAFGKDHNLKMEKDLEKSFYYINLAFNVTNTVKEEPGGKKIIDMVVNSGLALFDTFHGLEVNNKFDSKATQEKQAEEMEAALQLFSEMYF